MSQSAYYDKKYADSRWYAYFRRITARRKKSGFFVFLLRFEGINTPSIRSDVSNLIGLELSALLERPEGFCVRYQTDNGSILFDIDRICKQIIRVFLQGETITSDIDLYGYSLQNDLALKYKCAPGNYIRY